MNKIKLKEVVYYSKERISYDHLNINTYISTDNLLQNKQGVIRINQLPALSVGTTKYTSENILISNIRPYLKKILFAKQSGGVSSDVLTLVVKNGYYPKFIYYCLFQDIFFEHMMAGSKGTKMPRGDKNQILEFNIPSCSIEDQQKIAAVLSALDDKIELNNQINAELEQLAKTLYDYWFVQFDFPDKNGKPYKSSGGKMIWNEVLKREIPEGWEDQSFNHWISETKSGDWGKERPEGNYTEYVFCVRGADINGLNGKGEINAPERYILKNNLSKRLKPNDFIIEISGGSPSQSTARMALLTEKTFDRFGSDVICSNFCKAVSIIDEKYIFNFQQEWQRLYDAGVFFGFEGKTSGIKNFLFESFMESYRVTFPPKKLAEKFYNSVKSLEEKRQSNLLQNQQLASLRDWLLPLLMNGQVKIK